VETITTSIEIAKEDITITLAYAPPVPRIPENSSHHLMGSYLPPA
jgi:site-specific DNA recombinase